MSAQVSKTPSGRLVVLEGPDGCGKSTQTGLLTERLREFGYEAIAAREPGSTPVGEAIRNLVFDYSMDSLTQLLCFEAARRELLSSVVEPAMKSGAVVVLDRYTPSTLVYQGNEIGEQIVGQLEQLLGYPTPDVTFVLDVGLPLAYLGSDPFEQSDLELWKLRRDRYRELAAKYGWVLLDGTATQSLITDQMVKVLAEKGFIDVDRRML
jgi:dTMP kinase